MKLRAAAFRVFSSVIKPGSGMRIIYCQKMIFPNGSAHAIHTGMTAANFAAAGAAVRLFPGTPSFGGRACLADFFARLGFESPPENLEIDRIPFRHKGLYSACFRRKLQAAMREAGRLLCFASSVKEAVLALELRARLGRERDVRVVFEVHHLISRIKTGSEAEKLYELERKAFSEADMLLFNCETLREEARGYLPEGMCEAVSPLGFNDRTVRPALEPEAPEPGEASGAVNAVYVGSLQPGKGVRNLIRSVPLMPENVTLTVVGGWPKERLQPMKDLAAGLKVADRVRFAGLVRQRQLGDILRGCDIFVIPINTDKDFFAPIKMYEALGFAMPIVATPMPSLRLALKDGENALIASGIEPRNLAAAIVRLGLDPEARQRMRRANREAAKAFSASARAKALLNLFRDRLARA